MDYSDRDRNTLYLASLTNEAADPAAFDALFAATYDELRRLAGAMMNTERVSHTLQPTALVNEAYLRLFHSAEVPLLGRAHFMNMAARVMRRVLVDHARRKNSGKRGGGWQAVTLDGIGAVEVEDGLDVLELDEALAKLEIEDSRAAKVVELRIFGALKMEEIAEQLGVTRRTIQKDWRYATLWLRRELSHQASA